MIERDAMSTGNNDKLMTFKKLKVVLGPCLLRPCLLGPCLLGPCLLGFDLIRRKSFITALLGLGSIIGHDTLSADNNDELMTFKKPKNFLGFCLLGLIQYVENHSSLYYLAWAP